MELTSCPKCGGAISSRASVCPHCNLNLSRLRFIKCVDCGTAYGKNIAFCPECGCPNPNIEKKKQLKIKYIKIILSVALIIFIILIGLGLIGIQKTKEEAYYSNMETVVYSMLDGAAKAETAGNLIQSVWTNAIYKENSTETDKYTIVNGEFVDDFNDALANLYADEDFSKSISEITENKSEVLALMKSLTNPPKAYEHAYSDLNSYYEAYLKITELIVNSNESLESFQEKFSSYDDDFIFYYYKMNLYLN